MSEECKCEDEGTPRYRTVITILAILIAVGWVLMAIAGHC